MRPYLVVEWNDTETSAKGWLCIFNMVRGSSGGGTRMHPTVTREEVIRLATAMGYKYQAVHSKTMGGCKAGIAYDYKAPDAEDVLRRFLYAISPYTSTGASIGSDLGTNYNFILKVFQEQGFTLPQTPWMARDPEVQEGIKTFDAMQSAEIDGFLINDMITGYGVIYALDEAWKIVDGAKGASVVIQGFGCVGASAAKLLAKLGYKVVGIADAKILAYCEDGLDIDSLLEHRKPFGELNQEKFPSHYEIRDNSEWLDVPCDIIVPAALEDVIHKDNVYKVKAKLIVEAANIPVTPEADEVLHKAGVALVPDFITNAGAVRYYDAIVYPPFIKDPVEAVKDVENCMRENTRTIFENVKKTGRWHRTCAEDIFAPAIQDMPEIR